MLRVLVLIYLLLPVAIVTGMILRHDWCNVDDPAARACRGTISPLTIRRCVPKCIPPPTELQEPIPTIARAFKNCESRVAREGPEAVLPYLRTTLAVIEAEHGRNSTAYADAILQASIILNSQGEGLDIIKPWSEIAVSVTPDVYGMNHRQTAFVFLRHASLLMRLNHGKYAEETLPLLHQGADIQIRIMGASHEGTILAQQMLAQALFQKWRQSEDRQSKKSLLDEAEKYLKRAIAAYPQNDGQTDLSKENLHSLSGRVAFARGQYEEAVAHFKMAFDRESLVLQSPDCAYADDACRDYAAALRRLGREEEAAKVEEAIKGPLVSD